jgi:hypothetical protein
LLKSGVWYGSVLGAANGFEAGSEETDVEGVVATGCCTAGAHAANARHAATGTNFELFIKR